ncbi:MAG: hypothetical protein GX446_10655 [Chthonomonadales bacterium]|nr:hypothetical protein [Chthonomonadales bacterium]
MSNVLVVLDVGAHAVSAGVADNTAALQRALNAAGKVGGTAHLAARPGGGPVAVLVDDVEVGGHTPPD